MIYELSNPSDQITFEGDNIPVAGVACILLGKGWYALSDEKGHTVVPVMIGGATVAAWLQEQGISNLDDWLTLHAKAVADFLDTLVYGDLFERQSYREAITRMTPEKAAEYKAWWDDKQRSSLNNIGETAAWLARKLRKVAAQQAAVEVPG